MCPASGCGTEPGRWPYCSLRIGSRSQARAQSAWRKMGCPSPWADWRRCVTRLLLLPTTFTTHAPRISPGDDRTHPGIRDHAVASDPVHLRCPGSGNLATIGMASGPAAFLVRDTRNRRLPPISPSRLGSVVCRCTCGPCHTASLVERAVHCWLTSCFAPTLARRYEADKPGVAVCVLPYL